LARTARLPGATSEEAPAAELLLDVDAFMRADRAVARGLVTHVRRTESVRRLEDLVMHRANWGWTVPEPKHLSKYVMDLMDEQAAAFPPAQGEVRCG
jgi:hypothetical protein